MSYLILSVKWLWHCFREAYWESELKYLERREAQLRLTIAQCNREIFQRKLAAARA
jgi:hypothetical protein